MLPFQKSGDGIREVAYLVPVASELYLKLWYGFFDLSNQRGETFSNLRDVFLRYQSTQADGSQVDLGLELVWIGFVLIDQDLVDLLVLVALLDFSHEERFG